RREGIDVRFDRVESGGRSATGDILRGSAGVVGVEGVAWKERVCSRGLEGKCLQVDAIVGAGGAKQDGGCVAVEDAAAATNHRSAVAIGLEGKADPGPKVQIVDWSLGGVE